MSTRCFSLLVLMGFFLFSFVLSASVMADSGDMVLTFPKPNHAAGDQFGSRMAAFGENILIASPFDDTAGFGAGAVYMYNTSGALLQTFYNPTPYSGPAGSEYFSRSLGSVGNSVLVGDIYDSSFAQNAGSVYMFDGTMGQLQQVFKNPSGAGGDWVEEIENFGAAVTGIGQDRVLVGAFSKNDQGTAYVFDAQSGELAALLTSPTPQQFSRFGYSVATIGNIIAVGQPRYDRADVGINDSGEVHLFDATTYAYLRTLVDPTPTTNNEQFGYSLAALGDKLVVGGGKGVYVFDPVTGSLTLSIENPSLSRIQVAAVGEDILVGHDLASTSQGNNVGRALIYDGQTGELITEIANPNPDASDYFGSSVVGVGGYVAVGAPLDDPIGFTSGSVYLFEHTAPEPCSLALMLTGGGLLLRRKNVYKPCRAGSARKP